MDGVAGGSAVSSSSEPPSPNCVRTGNADKWHQTVSISQHGLWKTEPGLGEEGSFSLAEGSPSPPQQVKPWLADAPPSAQAERECSTKEQFIKVPHCFLRKWALHSLGSPSSGYRLPHSKDSFLSSQSPQVSSFLKSRGSDGAYLKPFSETSFPRALFYSTSSSALTPTWSWLSMSTPACLSATYTPTAGPLRGFCSLVLPVSGYSPSLPSSSTGSSLGYVPPWAIPCSPMLLYLFLSA